ncbi:MAG TPA: hypothetical protein DCF68_01535 [Cyanothece sp. UBA12306]|nr:hypothetical protein [Cyanothece sp. UBA12306]
MSQKKVIDYFGLKLPLARLHSRTTVKFRRKIYDFLKQSLKDPEKKTFLDHGSTPETTREASNCFIRWLLEDGAKVYATSPENIHHLEQIFPGLVVLNWPLESDKLPRIDYIISSAVIEHVGSEIAQVDYVRSLLALNGNILLTTPNRYHWLEFHTKLPLVHWFPRNLHRRVLSLLGLDFWAMEKNLRLLSEKDLTRIVKKAAQMNNIDIHLTWYKPKLLGKVSNLCILIESSSVQ